jgi:hypothetical protein
VTVLDADNRLTADYRTRVAAAIPSGVVVPDEFWTSLTEIIVGYVSFDRHYRRYPIAAERKRWKRIGDAVETLGVDLRRLRRETPWSDPDPLWPNRALAALWEVREKVEGKAKYHGTFGRRQNSHRNFLYGGVLDCWIQLGRELRRSRDPKNKNKAGGPTVRFFVACVAPVLGEKMVGPEGIVDIIKREKKGRAHLKRELKRLRQRWEREGPMGF